MTTSDENPSNSETTGLVRLGSALERAIGLLAGGTGCVEQQKTSVGLPAVRAVTAAEAVETDERIVDRPDSWPIPLRSCIVGVQWRDYSTTSHGWDGFPTGYTISPAVSAETVEMARNYYRAYRDLCAPLDEDSLARELLKLRVTTIRRAEEGHDWQLTMEAWLDELRPYPADIVLWALGFWRRCEKFWPTWSEFQMLLDRRVSQRRACMDALEQIGRRGQIIHAEAANA